MESHRRWLDDARISEDGRKGREQRLSGTNGLYNGGIWLRPPFGDPAKVKDEPTDFGELVCRDSREGCDDLLDKTRWRLPRDSFQEGFENVIREWIGIPVFPGPIFAIVDGVGMGL